MTTEEMITYDQIVELGIATAEEINLVKSLMSGSWTEVLNGIIFVRTGYHSMQQYFEAEDIEEEDEENDWDPEDFKAARQECEAVLAGLLKF
jgi:hypothetical protein